MNFITSESIHFKEGSSNPVKQTDVLRLYSMKLCPFAERARLILLVKKLRHEIVNIHLKEKPGWYLTLNPQGKVPALDIGSKIVTESLDVCDYLDETYSEPKLYPSDPDAKAYDKELILKFNRVIELYYDLLRNHNTKLSELATSLFDILEEYDNELGSRGDYFGGNQPGMVDYMIWPWAERSEVLVLEVGQKLSIPEDKIIRIRTWCNNMKKLDVIKNTIISADRAHNLFKLYQANGPVDYDNV